MKNIIAIAVLAILGAVAFFLFRETPNPEKQKTEQAAVPLDADKIDEIHIKRLEGIGDKKQDEAYTLKKQDGKWQMTEPVTYPVVESFVTSMINTLSTFDVVDIISEKASSHGKFNVDDKTGIDVTVLGAGKELLHVVIGASGGGMTFVRYSDKDEVYRMKGSFKFQFDRSIKAIREKTIIKADIENLKTATFGTGKDALVLEKVGTGKELSVKPVNKEIPDFDASKAVGVARTLVNLNAVEFVDEPLTDEVSGLGPEAFIIKVDAMKEDKPYQVTLTLGNKAEGKAQVYTKRSGSDQIFLISEYTANRLKSSVDGFVKKDKEKDKKKK
jgi:hypothetical protein